jgi:uncharacterized protein
MPILVNLRHLEKQDVNLEGELPVVELDIDMRDETVQLGAPLDYDLQVQRIEDALLVEGSLSIVLSCQCVRCLKPFTREVSLPKWAVHLPIEGEDAAAVHNDCVDLTPYVREDILLEFPQHPLCDSECGGLPQPSAGQGNHGSDVGLNESGASAWAELNKLKL